MGKKTKKRDKDVNVVFISSINKRIHDEILGSVPYCMQQHTQQTHALNSSNLHTQSFSLRLPFSVPKHYPFYAIHC